MPLYEYECQKCGKDFTLLQSASVNKDETECSHCGARGVKSKFSTFSARGGKSATNAGPVTARDLPNPDVLKLPIPRLRSEL